MIGTFINEGISMLLEGVPAPTIEQASSQAGYPAPVLQLVDELNMKLMRKIRLAAKVATEASGETYVAHAANAVIDRMLDEFDRPGRLEGAGFYEYEGGKRTGQWPGCKAAFGGDEPRRSRSRTSRSGMMFIEAIETVKCMDEGVIESVADANIGSIFGHRLPRLDRGRRAVHERLRGRPGRLRRARP